MLQAIDWGNLLTGSEAELNRNGTMIVDPTTLQSRDKDIFAGGDAVTGPGFAIDAIAQGKEAAVSIHRFVNPGQSLLLGRTNRDYKAFSKEGLDLSGFDRHPRQKALSVHSSDSHLLFQDLRDILSEEQVRKETERCLGCGAAVVDEYLCVGCGACTQKCRFEAVSLVRNNDAKGLVLTDIRPAVMRHAVKRKIRLAVLKPVSTLKNIMNTGV